VKKECFNFGNINQVSNVNKILRGVRDAGVEGETFATASIIILSLECSKSVLVYH
jgi:hypothetical protein